MWKSISDLFAGAAPLLSWLGFLLGLLVYFQNRKTAKRTAQGRYLKIHNMLISVAARVNHEVIDPWRLFNIIYIMRTNLKSGRIQHFVVMIILLTASLKSSPYCVDITKSEPAIASLPPDV